MMIAGGPSAFRLAVAMIPVIIVTIFVSIITFVALALDEKRRNYALDLAETFVDLAAVLVGRPPD